MYQNHINSYSGSKILNVEGLTRSESQSKLTDHGIIRNNSQKTYQKSSKTLQLGNINNYHNTSNILSKNGQNILSKNGKNFLTQKHSNLKITKSSSQPKIRTFKQEILRIPKVKQILQKDKLIFQQDIEKRLQLIGDVKNQKYSTEEYIKLRELNKPVVKKTRRHKTNYKIPLTRDNINSLNNIIQHHISQNQHFKNQQLIYLSQQDYKQPFNLKKLQFMQQINPLKKMYKQKFPQFKEGVLKKNKLLLEHVILNRNIKREMKLDQKKKKNTLLIENNQKDKNSQLLQQAKTIQFKAKI